jgi:hypothetical protein
MPTAKPRYDKDGSWKYKEHSHDEWETLKIQVKEELRPFYPDQCAKEDATFGHPSDAWAIQILTEADRAVSQVLSMGVRLSNAELLAEQRDASRKLAAALASVSNLSRDLDVMLGVDADLDSCKRSIGDILRRIEAAKAQIKRLPRANKIADVQRMAAIEMAIRVLRAIKGEGGKVSATADAAGKYTSTSIQILKIVGDKIGLVYEHITWKGHIKAARKSVSDL